MKNVAYSAVMCAAVWLGLRATLSVAPDSNSTTSPPAAVTQPAPVVGVENLARLSGRVYSGGEPGTDQAFAALKSIGIETVVSVDGIRPDVEVARRHGLRYVHIPVGYDGIPDHAAKSLAAVMKTTTGAVFIHCHHGRHRGPAAAAIACRAEGTADVARSRQILDDAGTSRDYAGLWRDVAAFVPPPAQAELPDLVEVAEVDTLAESMAKLSRSFDRLTPLRASNWSVPNATTDRPATEPSAAVADSLIVSEALRETRRTSPPETDAEFTAILVESDELASSLVTNLRERNTSAASTAFDGLAQSCVRCHRLYRD